MKPCPGYSRNTILYHAAGHLSSLASARAAICRRAFAQTLAPGNGPPKKTKCVLYRDCIDGTLFRYGGGGSTLAPSSSAPPSMRGFHVWHHRRRGAFGFHSPRGTLQHFSGIRSRRLPLPGSGIRSFIASKGTRRDGSGAGLSEKGFISGIPALFGGLGTIEILIIPSGGIPTVYTPCRYD